ncbi:erythromycin esterase family protein [Streptomyces sp. SID13031]|uniref:erythromycin esterase family protein n=1 Tax=Streptomyces sp. SID13031 TaxID=2706046 RepID=UPI0013CC6F36|nr:erythromycin esterase family protein [Streptomyces sp. SID13031]NEA36432.1 erythromycin esterase family protein [Streptomyces sp. SID13031]
MKRLLALPALLVAAALPLSTVTATAAPTQVNPVPALTAAAHPIRSTAATSSLRDLTPLAAMVGDARIVGLGEATHSSSEFLTLKHKIFRSLVEEKGFTTFALEAPWSTGLELDRYIVSGVGDPREIMRREFQDAYKFWNVQEYLDLIEWMRSYNRTHARKLHFVGDDLGYASPALLDRVTSYVGKTSPALLPEIKSLYAGIRSDSEYAAWSAAYFTKPLAERVKLAAGAQRAVVLVESLPASPERTWAAQHARAIWQVAKFYSFDITDPKVTPKAMYFRDESMAANTAWWARTTRAKVVLSAHNGHIALEAGSPADYPKTQGQFLREQFGRDYVTVGTSFDHGSFNSHNTADGQLRVFTVPPAAKGSNEYTLDKVPYRDYLIDLRRLPGNTRDWLDVRRPTRDIGTGYPTPELPIRLAPSYDLLIHLNQVSAAHLRF